jgi:hypothetical protein
MFSPVAKILLVYGSTDVEVSLIATQKNSCSGNLFKNFSTYDLSHLILEPTSYCKDEVLNRHIESSSNSDLISPVPWHAYEQNALAIAEWMLLLLPHFLAF